MIINITTKIIILIAIIYSSINEKFVKLNIQLSNSLNIIKKHITVNLTPSNNLVTSLTPVWG